MPTEWIWAFVASGGPAVPASSEPAPTVARTAPGDYTLTWPQMGKGSCGALGTLNSSHSRGVITVVPPIADGSLAPNQIRVLTADLSGELSSSFDFTVAVPCSVTAPPPVTQPPRVVAFASVRSDGTVRRSFPPVSVTRLGAGHYNVAFDGPPADIARCTIVATISTASSDEGRGAPSPGEISVSTADRSGSGFFVFTYNSTAFLGAPPAASDRGFDVAVLAE